MNNISYKSWQVIIRLPAIILSLYYRSQNGHLFKSQAEVVVEILCKMAREHQKEIIGQLAEDILKEIPDQLSDITSRKTSYLLSLCINSIAVTRDTIPQDAFSSYIRHIAIMVSAIHNSIPFYVKIGYHVFNYKRSLLKTELLTEISSFTN
jgi:hypothetical protein